MKLWVILYFPDFKSYHSFGIKIKVKTFELQKIQGKKSYLNSPYLTKAESPESTATINPSSKRASCEFSCHGDKQPILSVPKKPNKTFLTFPL